MDFVGGSSSVLVVGGRCVQSSGAGSGCSNLSVWDTMAPTASSCVGRLGHHQVCAAVPAVLLTLRSLCSMLGFHVALYASMHDFLTGQPASPWCCLQSAVTAVSMLPGGWLLAAGDAEGGLSCTDLRMIGGSSGEWAMHKLVAHRSKQQAAPGTAVDRVVSSSMTLPSAS